MKLVEALDGIMRVAMQEIVVIVLLGKLKWSDTCRETKDSVLIIISIIFNYFN